MPSLSPHQFAQWQDERGFISGQHARNIFREAGIRMWTPQSAPHLGRSEGYIEYNQMGTRSDTGETLHTAQQHLHGPTLASLMEHGLRQADVPRDEPIQTYSSRRGHQWIEEGHHRLVAGRLTGQYASEIEKGHEYG